MLSNTSTINSSFADYPLIDWQLLMQASQYFTGLDYKQVEVPWIVPESLTQDTKPHDNRSFVMTSDMFKYQPHELVGSAEQGFIYALANKEIKPGAYWSISPCFRYDAYDALHFPWFMKLELCVIPKPEQDKATLLKTLIQHCMDLYTSFGEVPTLVPIGDTFDIEINGDEVGSYGIREITETPYIYGTGLALPRFSIARR